MALGSILQNIKWKPNRKAVVIGILWVIHSDIMKELEIKKSTMKNSMGIAFLIIFIGSVQCCNGQIKKEELQERTESTYSIQEKQRLQKPLRDTAGYFEKTTITGIDFRLAARKVTPGVVHVNSKWKSVEDRSRSRTDPFWDFFGHEFYYRYFEPFRRQVPLQTAASGVIVTADGYIITNNHVIEGANEIEVVLSDQRSYPAKVVGTDPQTDLALLKIDEENLNFIPFGNSDNVEVGEWVLAVGNPFNLASTVTAGIVSAKARNINILRDREAIESFIQTDAAVNPGNSGGALVDLTGYLVGINTAIATSTGTYSGYSFAIPINIVKKVADDLLDFGTVQRGYLGIGIRDMTGTLAKELNLEFVPGVYVVSVVQDGAAMEAGIEPGDIITKINENTVETSPQLQEIVARHRPGERLVVAFMRNNQEKSATATLKKTSPEVVENKTDEKAVFELLGLEAQEVSVPEKRRFGIQNGLKVTKLKKGKISEFTTMREGFVILKIDGIPIFTKEDLVKIITHSQGGIMIEGIYPGRKEVVFYGFGID